MAVWLIDARGLAGLVDRSGWRSLRRTPRGGTTAAAAAEPSARPAPEPLAATTPADPEPVTTTARVAYETVEAPLEPLPTQSPRRDAKRVPAAYTAVEGAYRDVARVPLWRKLLSLASLLGILIVVAATVAALAGATIGLVAELVDGAIG